jgi:SAM-dependent methyltransferase
MSNKVNRVMRTLPLAAALAWSAIALWQFPWATDGPVDRAAEEATFYASAYELPTSRSKEERDREEKYVAIAKRAAEAADIEGMVRKFVDSYHLNSKRVLDVGSGRGYLQDVVPDFTGLDISSTAARFYHKRFVLGSATAMPFRDGEFDAIWSIWVLEHIPNPEAALSEMRRVLKPGGMLLLAPAWGCDDWAADGYAVRPYSDFGISGRLIKASVPLRESTAFRTLSLLSNRALRILAFRAFPGATRLHYRRLTPNYKEYWVPDSDAVNSIDSMEAAEWFRSRGDECLSCPSKSRILQPLDPLVIRVKKSSQLAANDSAA